MSAQSQLVCYLNCHLAKRRLEFINDPDVIIKFHIFSNNVDDFTPIASEALTIYRHFKQEYGDTRLYIDVDDGQGQTLVEDCLLSYGAFPT